MVRVNLRGFRALDRRTAAARGAIEFRSSLLQDLGGQDLSAARLALVDAATRTWLFIQHLDAWLLNQTSLVNAKRKAAMPILRDRQAMVESLSRLLGQLGLDRKAPPERSLADIVREIEQGKAAKALVAPVRATAGTKQALGSSGQGEPPEPPKAPGARQSGDVAPAQAVHVAGIPATSPEPLVVTVPSLRPPDPAYPVSPTEHPEPVEVPEF